MVAFEKTIRERKFPDEGACRYQRKWPLQKESYAIICWLHAEKEKRLACKMTSVINRLCHYGITLEV